MTLMTELDQANPAWELQGTGFHGSVMDNRPRYGRDTLNNALRWNRGSLVLIWRTQDTQTLYDFEGLSLSSMTIRLRNPSLLTADTTVLEQAENVDQTVASLMINGRSGNLGEMAQARVEGPAALRWRFNDPAKLTAIRLHQNLIFPTREVRIVLRGREGVVLRAFDRVLPAGRKSADEPASKTIYIADDLEILSLELHLMTAWGKHGMGLDLIEVLTNECPVGVAAGKLSVSTEFICQEGGPERLRVVREIGGQEQASPWVKRGATGENGLKNS